MPPQHETKCRYDDSEFKRKVEEHLWFSENSLTGRVKSLEERAKNRDRWSPVLFTVLCTGLFALLKIVTDVVFK